MMRRDAARRYSWMTKESAISADQLAEADETAAARAMDEESFRLLYARTARPLWAYLARVSGDRALADDLLQETYCRFFAAGPKEMSDAHQKHYLFRIALNLMRDHWRRKKIETVSHANDGDAERWAAGREAVSGTSGLERREEVGSALELVKPGERELLWLAYVEGFSHKEIADMTGVRAASLRPMLWRARKKLARLLGVKNSPSTDQPGVKS